MDEFEGHWSMGGGCIGVRARIRRLEITMPWRSSQERKKHTEPRPGWVWDERLKLYKMGKELCKEKARAGLLVQRSLTRKQRKSLKRCGVIIL